MKGKNVINKRIEKLVLDAITAKSIPLHDYGGTVVRFGLVADTQIGSVYEHNDVLNLAYDLFASEQITRVYHCGDLLDGEKMYRGQEYEIYAHGLDQQIKACAQRYPRKNGITTYFILGNHDLSFWRTAGVDVGPLVAKARPDLVYLGREVADVRVGNSQNKAHLRLIHPSKGTAYAISYQLQKYVESLSGGQKPQILLCGHYHKAEFLPCYRNVFTLQAGCIQGQTPFMQRQNIAAHIGFWIVEFIIDSCNSVRRLKTEFFAHYEEKMFVEV